MRVTMKRPCPEHYSASRFANWPINIIYAQRNFAFTFTILAFFASAQFATASIIWYRDADGDGYGGSTTISQTTRPNGYVSFPGDCNDANALVYPGATEFVADGIDQNCDSFETMYQDRDDDSVRTNLTVSVPIANIAQPGFAFGYEPAGDVNDNDAFITFAPNLVLPNADIDFGQLQIGESSSRTLYSTTDQNIYYTARFIGDSVFSVTSLGDSQQLRHSIDHLVSLDTTMPGSYQGQLILAGDVGTGQTMFQSIINIRAQVLAGEATAAPEATSLLVWSGLVAAGSVLSRRR